MEEKILIVDDEVTLNSMLEMRLEQRGFRVFTAISASEGLKLAYKHSPDLVILDIMMPEMDGYEACQRLREMTDVPILMLTAKTKEADLLRGFQVGADDYVKKPFSFNELEMRIHALLKRREKNDKEKEIYDDGRLRIDLNQQRVWVDGQNVHLTPTEFRLLKCLVSHEGTVVSHEELLTEAWGAAYKDTSSHLPIYIRYLRQKLEENPNEPKYIRTEWGWGYWFASSDQ
jgi:two-component system KDP operon response regulator KdpE